MPIKDIGNTYRHPEELHFTLPRSRENYREGGTGSFTIERLPDGGAQVSCRENINAWGSTETIRFDADAWAVVQAFVAGGEGGSFLAPFKLNSIAEEVRAEMAARKAKEGTDAGA